MTNVVGTLGTYIIVLIVICLRSIKEASIYELSIGYIITATSLQRMLISISCLTQTLSIICVTVSSELVPAFWKNPNVCVAVKVQECRVWLGRRRTAGAGAASAAGRRQTRALITAHPVPAP